LAGGGGKQADNILERITCREDHGEFISTRNFKES